MAPSVTPGKSHHAGGLDTPPEGLLPVGEFPPGTTQEAGTHPVGAVWTDTSTHLLAAPLVRRHTAVNDVRAAAALGGC